MEQDLIVFISSIMHDENDPSSNKELEAERDYVEEVIGDIPPFTPWVYEHKPASSIDRKTFYRKGIRESTIVILLLAKTLKEGVEDEYALALDLGKPLLVFIKRGPKDNEMQQFIKALEPKYKRFSSLDDLERHVREAINDEIRKWSKESAEIRLWRREQIEVAAKYWNKRQKEIYTGRNVPVQLSDRPGAILLLLPIASLKPGQHYDLKKISKDREFWSQNLQPFCYWLTGQELKVEPTRLHRDVNEPELPAAAYVQIHDNGVIESGESGTFINPRPDRENRNFLFINKFEGVLINNLGKYLQILKKLEVEAPAYLFLALTGTEVGVSGAAILPFYRYSLNWGDIPLREVIIKNYDEHPCKIVRSLVDSVWAAYGWLDGSPNFLNDGSYENKEAHMRLPASACQPTEDEII